ncbi:hypothetical protein [Tepidimicrobium xylanilyticum]
MAGPEGAYIYWAQTAYVNITRYISYIICSMSS